MPDSGSRSDPSSKTFACSLTTRCGQPIHGGRKLQRGERGRRRSGPFGAIPTEQYRAAYTFLAPSTYTYNYVNVVAPSGANITIMANPLQPKFTPIGGTSFMIARKKITGGTHQMTGDKNFGIVVYSYGSYTVICCPAVSTSRRSSSSRSSAEQTPRRTPSRTRPGPRERWTKKSGAFAAGGSAAPLVWLRDASHHSGTNLLRPL